MSTHSDIFDSKDKQNTLYSLRLHYCSYQPSAFWPGKNVNTVLNEYKKTIQDDKLDMGHHKASVY